MCALSFPQMHPPSKGFRLQSELARCRKPTAIAALRAAFSSMALAALSLAGRRLCLFVGLLVVAAEGHGRLTVPQARNGGDNGAAAGGAEAVHASHSKYKHGICGDAAGGKQVYNRVGTVQGTYVAGEVAELQVVITAHHVGYFEVELCADAGTLSEECFMKHRLLREDCKCSCPNDSTNSCSACDECRRWWKPVLEGEMSQDVTKGYAGPVLPSQGTLVPYQFTLRYVIPEGVKTSRGVLRWHYVTTNSCTSKTSDPEEFWNCADVAVKDGEGDFGPELPPFSNTDLESLSVEDLLPAINSGKLTGVFATCPKDAAGNLLGVGSAKEYADLCGSKVDDTYERCVDMSGGSGGSDVDCSHDGDVICASECSNAYFRCSNGVAYTMYVAEGTLCKDGAFVHEATCDSQGTTPVPTEPPEPTPTTAPTEEPVVTSTTEPTAAPTSTTESGSGHACGDCKTCLWKTGQCYDDANKDYCLAWEGNEWCAGA